MKSELRLTTSGGKAQAQERTPLPMSPSGQSRHFGRGLTTTGLPPTPDISLHRAK